jgi:hypothetical protein
VLYLLMLNRDVNDDYQEEPVGVFTSMDLMTSWIGFNLPPDGCSYSLKECMENAPGLWRRVDLAIEKIERPEPEDLAVQWGNPVVGETISGPGILDFRPKPICIEVFRALDQTCILRVFETSAGILDAQFKPEDLTPAATQFVREVMRIYSAGA